MVYWISKRYSEALEVLLEPSVIAACDTLWIYHNLVGMSARQVDGEMGRAADAFERQLL